MTVIDALYGSQYYDLKSKNYDVNKGRFYANLMLTATILIYFFLVILVLNMISDDITDVLTKPLRRIFGRSMGKSVSQAVAVPLIAIIYFAVALVFGSKKRYEKSYQNYITATQKEKDDALGKMLGIFIVGLGLLVVVAIVNLFL